jgi:hypothetical protein
MAPTFRDAVLDALLPAETAPPGGALGLPSGRALGIDLAPSDAAKPMLELIAAAAGSEAAFLAAAPAARLAAIATAEAQSPAVFRHFLAQILADYCETAEVLAALGGSTEPPQPGGQALPEMDAAAANALEKVRRRAKLWRG